MNDMYDKMDAEELRELARRQAGVIRACQSMTFTKDSMIDALEHLYRCRIDAEEARVEYDVKMANLQYFDDRMFDKHGEKPVCTCEPAIR